VNKNQKKYWNLEKRRVNFLKDNPMNQLKKISRMAVANWKLNSIILLLVVYIFLDNKIAVDFSRRVANKIVDFYVHFQIIGITQAILTGLGAYFIYRQIKRGEDVDFARFYVDLNDSLTQSKAYEEVFRRLTDYELKSNQYEPFCDEDIFVILTYLNFFVSMSALIEKGILTIEDIDELYAWRFFAAMDNPDIQKVELDQYNHYHSRLYFLYYRWHNYREGRGLPFPLEDVADTSLIKNKHYLKFLAKINRERNKIS
jgi:hypothetical protein